MEQTLKGSSRSQEKYLSDQVMHKLSFIPAQDKLDFRGRFDSRVRFREFNTENHDSNNDSHLIWRKGWRAPDGIPWPISTLVVPWSQNPVLSFHRKLPRQIEPKRCKNGGALHAQFTFLSGPLQCYRIPSADGELAHRKT